jgi:hypothetical protein
VIRWQETTVAIKKKKALLAWNEIILIGCY